MSKDISTQETVPAVIGIFIQFCHLPKQINIMHMITIITELAIEVCHLEVQISVKLKASPSKISYIVVINEKLNRTDASITESKLKSVPKKANACVYMSQVKFHSRLKCNCL